jgi:hypothetical protein
MTASSSKPSDLSPPSTISLTPDERIRVWLDLMEFTDELFLAGLRHRIGPEGDLQAAVREWYRRDREQRDEDIAHFMKRLHRRDGAKIDGR